MYVMIINIDDDATAIYLFFNTSRLSIVCLDRLLCL